MKRYQIILIAIFLVAAIGIVGQSDANEEQRSAEQYCHMVKLWKETTNCALTATATATVGTLSQKTILESMTSAVYAGAIQS